MRTLVMVVALAAIFAVGVGTVSSRSTAPVRQAAHGVVVGPEWYSALSIDPVVATEAFMERIPAEARARGDAFGRTRYVTLPLRILVLVASIALIMFSGAAAGMRRIAARVSQRAAIGDSVFAVQLMVSLYLLNLPVETYAGFVRFRNAGFSQASFLQWFSGFTISWATITVFYVVGLVAIMALIRRRPATWSLWAVVVYAAVSSTYVLVTPQFIEPLMNEVSPLVDGPQKQMILSLARANGVPATDVFVRDASRQSVLLDAHVSGFGGSARIVLDDNTIAKVPDAEVRMVMAHEIGHYVLAHIPKGVVFDALLMGFGILCIAGGAKYLIARFGERWDVSGVNDVAAIPVLWGLFLMWGFLSIPLSNSISRQQEAEADLFGLNASQEPLAQAEWMIRDADTGQMNPSAMEEFAFYSHPSPRNRILVAMRWRAEQGTIRPNQIQ